MLNTQELQQSDSTHYLHPFTDAKSLKKKGARVITRAEGIYLWDSDGNRLLDGMAGLWCVNVGYGRKVLAQTAMRQLEELPYYNTFFQTTHPPAVALSEKLAPASTSSRHQPHQRLPWQYRCFCQHGRAELYP